MAFFNGTTGDATFSSLALKVTDWEAEAESTELPSSTVADSGYYKSEGGLRKCTGSLTAHFDSTIHSGTTCPVKDGNSGTLNLEIEPSGPKISGTAKIFKTKYKHSFDSLVEITCNFSFQGAFKLPGEP